MARRVENAVFFASERRAQGVPHVQESAFYTGRARPAPETSVAIRLAATSRRFSIAIFLIGWAGILFQASFLQQVVFGAPVFEELAKVGLALVPVAFLRIRSLPLRLALAWASGAGFGIMEHYVTYSDESMSMYGQRIAFHALATGLSMLYYHAFETLPDVRTRWAATLPSTLVHWANNFGAVALGLSSIALPIPDAVGMAWGVLLSSLLVTLTVWAIVAWPAFKQTSRDILAVAMPRFGVPPVEPHVLAEAEAPPMR